MLAGASRVECPELATVELGPIWLSSLGNTNRTPWQTDREYDEEELARQIDEMVAPFADRPLDRVRALLRSPDPDEAR